MTINGNYRNTSASSGGPTTNVSSYVTLPASPTAYNYTVSIDVYQSNPTYTSAGGGIDWYQL